VSENQEVKVRIIHIDPERRRMGLSMKQVEDQENWSEYQEQVAEEEKETPDVESDESIES
jgi:ribosomal protein S1